ncbi:NAD-dependent epimerase/dehydratase,Thermophilic glucose-6-phosphate isomerase and related metalloenzymes,ADP-glyceromanno-heptose 6-epimerase,NAD dependent epimerase/dehydratase family [[Clostridium] sordellii]|uniref:polysaccharide biosynthesis C-terminal domain-containing protein n=1 Tax=Paraclostridium sordellii TaxID=1505 RepID=UPI000543818C|nr:NAD-dependent epimerase/dehydratase family protein [Paeniclostridium sordellii]CEK32854.1 NAD-dependent epimerase/dehydratase,Thermophilic glucose-6-phosphate isomerase and related metalloenzymes,ADP-glyceromanno-heptose 6-epimerase,NAD dependent epimerase/dehydratase family [[Clostridium] sordellii] [Paeniclostridium sordellii]
MKKILVTGSNGFVGKNTVVALKEAKKYEVLTIDRNNTEEELKEAVLNSDFIVHLAGVNRPKETKEFYEGNGELTEKIVSFLREENKNTPILITSSTQAKLDNDYGKSKKQSEDILISYSEDCNAKVYIFRLPNLFGKWCKPNYNSAVSTFCYNIAHDLDVWVKDPNIELNLVYIDDVVESIIDSIEENNIVYINEISEEVTLNNIGASSIQIDKYYYEVTNVYKRTLGNIVDSLKMFRNMRNSLLIPDLSDSFNKALYSTYLTYLEEDNFSYYLDKKEDNRGWLAELVKSEQFGQMFVSKTRPGITRGNHWHHTKTEKFIVIQGQAIIKFRKIDEEKVIEYIVDGERPQVLDIPPGYTHSIENIGQDEVITLFWSNEMFNPEKTDTYFLEVNK